MLFAKGGASLGPLPLCNPRRGRDTVPNVRDDFMKNLDRIMPGDSEPAAVLVALQRMLLYADCRLQRITAVVHHDEDLT